MFGRRKRRSSSTYLNKDGYPVYKDSGVPAHIRAAEKKVGGKIFPGRVVHHIDGDKTNYRQDNVQVMSRSDHLRLHAKLRRHKKTANTSRKRRWRF
jgi:hypothetical protein